MPGMKPRLVREVGTKTSEDHRILGEDWDQAKRFDEFMSKESAQLRPLARARGAQFRGLDGLQAGLAYTP